MSSTTEESKRTELAGLLAWNGRGLGHDMGMGLGLGWNGTGVRIAAVMGFGLE